MLSYLALPRTGHLEQLYHIFKYLKIYHNTEMVFDPRVPVIDSEAFLKLNWPNMVHASGNAELTDVLLLNMPRTRKESFTIHAFVDSNHAGDYVTVNRKILNTIPFILEFSISLLSIKVANIN